MMIERETQKSGHHVRPSDALLKLLHELLQCWPVGGLRKKMVVCFLTFSKLSPQLTALVCPSNFSSQFHPVSPTSTKHGTEKNLASPTPLVALTHPPFSGKQGGCNGPAATSISIEGSGSKSKTHRSCGLLKPLPHKDTKPVKLWKWDEMG